MNKSGLLSKNVIRQIHSDVVSIEALSRLQFSVQSDPPIENLQQSI